MRSKITEMQTQQENLENEPNGEDLPTISETSPIKSVRKPRKDKGISRKENSGLESKDDIKMTDLILEFQDKRRALKEKYQRKIFALMDL